MPHIDSSQWLGPLGGLLCIAFAMGCIAGWSFAMKLMKSRIDDLKTEIMRERNECDRRINGLEYRVREVEERYTHGMERQLGQVRASSYQVIVDGEEREQLG